MFRKYRVSRIFQNTTDYKGEGLTKKDVLRILFLAFLIRVSIYILQVCLSICAIRFLSHAAAFSLMIFSICGINLMPSIILISRKRICQLHRSNGMVWQRRASISRLLSRYIPGSSASLLYTNEFVSSNLDHIEGNAAKRSLVLFVS